MYLNSILIWRNIWWWYMNKQMWSLFRTRCLIIMAEKYRKPWKAVNLKKKRKKRKKEKDDNGSFNWKFWIKITRNLIKNKYINKINWINENLNTRKKEKASSNCNDYNLRKNGKDWFYLIAWIQGKNFNAVHCVISSSKKIIFVNSSNFQIIFQSFKRN